MYSVGLIGGVASGKTTVSQVFADLGAEIISADLIAKQLTALDQPAYKVIVQHLGQEILMPTMELDRRLLRDKMLDDVCVRSWLEALLHPLIRQSMQNMQKNSLAAYVILEIPLLKNKQDYPYLKRVLWVKSSPEQQLQRLMDRDQVSRSQAEKMISCQLDHSLLESLADDVLSNTDNVQGLSENIHALHQKYLNLSGFQ